MTADLLEWMSYRGKGRFADLPAHLVRDPSRPRVVETLALLGHVERVGIDAWQVAPPVLAGLPAGKGPSNALLCGARTRRLLSRLEAACGKHGAEMTTARPADGPAAIRIHARSTCVLGAVAGELGLAFQRDSAFSLLACIPAVKDWPRTQCEMVRGRVETVRRFSRSRLDWVDSTLKKAGESRNGLFRIQRDWDWVSIIKMGPEESAYIDVPAGRLIVAAKLKAAKWEPEQEILSFPAKLSPPVLIARALALCSGTVPYFDDESHRICFSGVPPEVVRLALPITGLRLE